MKFLRERIGKVLSVLMSAVFVLTSMFAFAPADIAEASGGIVSKKEAHTDSYGREPYFEITNNHGINFAFCIDFNAKAPAQGTGIGEPVLSNNDALRRVLYYGNGGPGDLGAYTWTFTAMAASSAVGNIPSGKGDHYTGIFDGLPVPPSNFKVYTVSTGQAGYQPLAYWVLEAPKGSLELYKGSTNSSITDGNACYSLEGCVVAVYKHGTDTEVGRFITEGNGYGGKLNNLDAGQYDLKELQAPKGYVLDSSIKTVTVNPNATTTYKLNDIPANDPVRLLLNKVNVDGDRVLTEAGSLAGAWYTFEYYDGQYSEEQLLGKIPTRKWVLETDEYGGIDIYTAHKVSGDLFYYTENQTRVIPVGTIKIYETKAPVGFNIDPTVYIVNIEAENYTGKLIKSYQPPTSPETVIRGGVAIEKYDSETGMLITDKETVFTIYNRNDYEVEVDGKIYGKDEAVMTITTLNGKASTEADALSYGDYEIVETRAPEGYNLTENRTHFSIKENGRIVELTGDNAAVDSPVRGDLEGIKAAGGTMKRLAGIPFKITSVETGESHVVVTDKNGYFSTSSDYNPHTQNTNRGKSSEDGVWFGEINALDNSVGALPYGSYIIEELECDANEDYFVIEPFTVEISKDRVTVDLGVITNDSRPEPKIKTTAKDAETGSRNSYADDEITIIDTVEYENLVPGREYTIKGIIIDKESEEPLLNFGEKIMAELTFTPDSADGKVELSFTFDGSGLEGSTLVVFENLYRNDRLIAAHADIEDEGQTIYIPKIGTTAKDSETGIHNSFADDEIIIVDTVSYENLIPGKEYTLKGILMNAENGEAVEIAEIPVAAEAVFIPKEADGTVDVTFTFEGTGLEGTRFVVFEDLYLGECKVAVHADIEDEEQTIYIPEIGTSAKDGITGTHTACASEEMKIVDTVSYANLIIGKEYIVTGMLIDKATGEAALDDEGNKIIGKTAFIPEEADGIIDVVFTFAGLNLAGKTIVAFETVTYENEKVAVHSDIEDGEQTIYIPKLGTSAKDAETDSQNSFADNKITIVDTVEYENLVAGNEYTVKGVIIDKATGRPLKVNDKEVTAETTFTAAETTGKSEVTFIFDGTGLEGSTLVVFEVLYSENLKAAVHADINDEGQTIYIPRIGTKAVDKATGKQNAAAGNTITIVDTVSYENLIAGMEYTVSGVLMDKETGKPLLADGKKVTGSAVFIAGEAAGTVDVKFTLNTADLAGKTVVVFEKVTLDGKDVAVHMDINDKNQSIKITKKPAVPFTGDKGAAGWILIGILAAGTAVFAFIKKENLFIK